MSGKYSTFIGVNEFVEWLNSELVIRGWSNNQLARKADISSGSVSMVMTAKTDPSWEFCAAVAGALGYPPEMVFRKAGLLRERIEYDKLQEVIDLVNNLPPDQVRILHGIALLLYRESK